MLAPLPVWIGGENLAPTGIRSPDRPGLSESLYGLSYHGPTVIVVVLVIVLVEAELVVVVLTTVLVDAVVRAMQVQ